MMDETKEQQRERELLDAQYHRAIPKPGEIWQHFKHHNYKIIACPVTHTETRKPYCVYQALYDDYGSFCRPLDMFMSEVDHDKYPQVTQQYRFIHTTDRKD